MELYSLYKKGGFIMARQVRGTSTILKSTNRIAQMVGKYGTTKLQADTNSDFVECVTGLVACWRALQALDDYPWIIDASAPRGAEDVTPGS